MHRSVDLVRAHTTRRAGIPVTNPLRTMVDLGAVLDRATVEDALERGLAARLFTIAGIEWMRNEVAERGRNGCGVLRTVLDERALGEDPPDGLLEPRMARLILSHGLPKPAFQHPVGRFRVDFAYPERRIAIEVDGYKVHGTPRATEADFDRQNQIVIDGWKVVRFTWKHVVRRPNDVARSLAAILEGKEPVSGDKPS